MTDYQKRMKKEQEYRESLIYASPHVNLTEESGIYIFTRNDLDTGLKHAYIGQAKHVISRLVEHCMSFEFHIDKSLKKHGFLSESNPSGWTVSFVEYIPEEDMNEHERYWINRVGNSGYQLLNKTSGGQDGGKVGIAPNAPARGYRDGLAQGYKNAQKDIAPLFEKYLDVSKKGTGRKDAEDRALQKFNDFIKNYKNI